MYRFLRRRQRALRFLFPLWLWLLLQFLSLHLSFFHLTGQVSVSALKDSPDPVLVPALSSAPTLVSLPLPSTDPVPVSAIKGSPDTVPALTPVSLSLPCTGPVPGSAPKGLPEPVLPPAPVCLSLFLFPRPLSLQLPRWFVLSLVLLWVRFLSQPRGARRSLFQLLLLSLSASSLSRDTPVSISPIVSVPISFPGPQPVPVTDPVGLTGPVPDVLCQPPSKMNCFIRFHSVAQRIT